MSQQGDGTLIFKELSNRLEGGRLAEKVGDLVRDAFYEACEAMQTWNGVLGPMSQDELFAAWMSSEARRQLLHVFPALETPKE